MDSGFQPQPFDRVLERLLFVSPNCSPSGNTAPVPRGGNVFGLPLLISAMRCILQYVLLPFVLPVLGVIGGAPVWLGLSLNVVAFVSLISSLRRVFRARHPRRYSYLPLAALMLFAVVIFSISDFRAMQ